MAAAAPYVVAGSAVYEYVGCYDERGVFQPCSSKKAKPCQAKNTDTITRPSGITESQLSSSVRPAAWVEQFPETAGGVVPAKLNPLNFANMSGDGSDFPVQPNYPSLPPWLYQPTTGLPFNPTTFITIPAIGVQATIIDFVVPNGYNGVINQLGNNFVGGGFVDGSGNLKWQLLIDGVPYPNFDNIISSLGNPASPSLIGAVNIRERQHVQLVVTNVAVVVAGQLIGGRLSGWFFPLDLADTTQWF